MRTSTAATNSNIIFIGNTAVPRIYSSSPGTATVVTADDYSDSTLTIASTYPTNGTVSDIIALYDLIPIPKIPNRIWDPAPWSIKPYVQKMNNISLFHRRIAPPFWTGKNFRKVK